MKVLKLNFWTLSIICLIGLAAPIWATPVTGGASISGSVTVTGTTINFMPTFSTQGGTAAQTGSFSGLTGGTYNVPTLTQSGTFPIVNFISFNQGVAVPIAFDLQQVMPGFGTAANCASNTIGAACTPANSPFTLIQTALGANPQVAVTLSLSGIAYTGTSASGSSPAAAIYTTQLTMPPENCNTVTSCLGLLASGGSVEANYSANFTTSSTSSIPEPGFDAFDGCWIVRFRLDLASEDQETSISRVTAHPGGFPIRRSVA